MKTIKTSERITRYVAFNNPGVFVENTLNNKDGGFDYAVFFDPTTNVENPLIEDGIYCTISSYRSLDIIVDCHLIEPIMGRRQHRLCERYNDYEEAKSVVLDWIPQAQQIVKNRFGYIKANQGI